MKKMLMMGRRGGIELKQAHGKEEKRFIERSIPVVGIHGTSIIDKRDNTPRKTKNNAHIPFLERLSKSWYVKYLQSQNEDLNSPIIPSDNAFVTRVNIHHIMILALPWFIVMSVVLALSAISGLEPLNGVFDLLLKGLPVLMAVLLTKQVSELGEVSIVSGVIVGVFSIEGGLISGIIGGILAGLLVRYLYLFMLNKRFPMTTVNIVSGTVSGLMSGLLMFYFFAPISLMIGGYIKEALEVMLSYNPVLAGFIAGLIIWPALLGGLYHTLILSLIFFEIERFGISFFGAVDVVGLVMVAAGINLANIILPQEKREVALAMPGFMINMGFGTFVESVYPFMFINKAVLFIAIGMSSLGGMMLGYLNLKGFAYLPVFVSPFMSSDALTMIMVMGSIFMLTCIFTLMANCFKLISSY